MSLETLKDQLRALAPATRRQLMAYLVVLEDNEDPDYRRRLARKIDDDSPDRWLPIEEVERRLRTDAAG